MPTTSRGAPYPAAGSSNNVPVDMQALAEWVNGLPGVTPLTTAARDALTGQALWDGRVIWNTSTLTLERYDAAATPSPVWRAAALSEAAASAAYLAKGGVYRSRVATSQTTTSGTFVDLATVGPVMTLTTGTRALVTVSCQTSHGSAGGTVNMGMEVTGATARAVASDETLVFTSGTAGQQIQASRTFLVTDLNAGSNTFTAKYAVSAGTGTFLRRELIVIPL